MSYLKEEFIKYLQEVKKNHYPGVYVSSLANIERLLKVNIDAEYESDECTALYDRLQELRKNPEKIGKNEHDVRQYASNLKKYTEFRAWQKTNSSIEEPPVMTYLRTAKDIIPDEYDGSYELVREIVNSYSTLLDDVQLTSKDLDAIYSMAIGTWKMSMDKKKEYILETHLPEQEKARLFDVIDNVWDKACLKKYEQNEVKGKPSVGMFGTGFYRFKVSDSDAHNFIKMLVKVKDAEESDWFPTIHIPLEVFKNDIVGMGASSASIILHCLQPTIFPIINGNMGLANIYEYLGIELTNPKSLTTYAKNCITIKMFCEKNFSFKNFRVLDYAARLINADSDDYWPSLEEYNPELTKEDWTNFINEVEITHSSPMTMLARMMKLGGQASCKQLSETFGESSGFYNSCSMNLGRRARKYFNKPGCMDGDEERVFVFAFQGKQNANGQYIYRIRPELKAALEEMDLSAFDSAYKEEVKEVAHMKEKFNKNIILYGPPGTGKTYNTVNYAVAIIEGKTVEEIQKEEYDVVKKRYENYLTDKQIQFTTFHQSYGYEDFIEGIKPVVDEDEDTISYKRVDGIFKKFCDDSRIKPEDSQKYDLNKNPNVWKVSLEGTGDNPTRKECLANNHIRIGWDDYGPNLSDITDYYQGGKTVLNSFVSKMQIGDIVLSCYTASTIDAIGIVTGEPEWHPEYEKYRRLRKVKWIVKGIKENILDINNGTAMTLSSVYRLNVKVADVLNIVEKHNPIKKKSNQDKRYVFIIDEINRGNISKIFGELITLLEESKREGETEQMSAILPYSQLEFSVPNNVYVLGTMNTADRSIALMDTALRRRFDFVEMMPESKVLEGVEVAGLNIAKMLDTINDRITFLYDREHTIGHAFFIPLKQEPTIEKLAEIFKNKLIPLLQEYFYEDYEKIQLVLGDNDKKEQFKFIKDVKVELKNIFKGSATIEFELPEVKYEINKDAFLDIESYKQIM